MLEIYYTSAPEGLKSGSSGFCTVAATDGIAKPVLERLEALSGYRHHFAQGQGQTNPVSHAHWKLSAGGKEYHVLSRVYDSGVDHTHRTNAFAHHLALESSELAPGGPVALLTEPGVMMPVWDGKVGPLSRTTLPMVGGRPPAACRAWAAAAGDAGYAGLLLEAAIRTPTKPVCILFNPGQEMLPLIDEVLRLLPTAARWGVTFNTYFTSMPTSASCTWRCCIAKTPAADAALRAAAAGGIVLNLTEPGKLPPLPENEYVAAARSGTSVAPALSPTAARQVAKKPLTKLPPQKAAPPALELELEEEIPVTGEPLKPAPGAGFGLAVDEAPLPELRAHDAPYQPAPSMRATPSAPIRNVEALLSQAEGHAARAKKKRQQQLLLMYGLAAAAVAASGLILFMALRQNHEADLDTSSGHANTRPVPPPVATSSQEVPETEPVVVETKPAETEPVRIVETKPAETKPIVIYVRPSRTIVTKIPLDDPQHIASLEKSQTIILSPEDAEDLKQIVSLVPMFPGDVPEYKYETPTLSGTFIVSSNIGNKNPSVIISWRDSFAIGGGTKVATLTYDHQANRHQLVVIWSSNFLITNHEVASIAYWVLSQTTLLGMDGTDPAGNRAKAQKIVFKPTEIPPITLSEDPSTLKWPAELPPGCHPVLAGELPKGWIGKFSIGDGTGQATHAAENEDWTLSLKYPTSSKAVDAFFTVKFKSHFTSIHTDCYKRIAADESDFHSAQADLQRGEAEVKSITDRYAPELERLEGIKNDYEKRALTPAVEGWKPEQAKEVVRAATLAWTNKKKDMDRELKGPLAANLDRTATVLAFQQAMDAYKAIDTVDVTFRLPNELPALTVRLKKK